MSTGVNWAAATSPSASGSLVSWSTSQAWATLCIHVPANEMSWPNQNSRKLRWLNADRPRGSCRPARWPRAGDCSCARAICPDGCFYQLHGPSHPQSTRIYDKVVVARVHPVRAEGAANVFSPRRIDGFAQAAQGAFVELLRVRRVVDARKQITNTVVERGHERDVEHARLAREDEGTAPP